MHLPTHPPQLLPRQLHHVRISLFFFFPSSLAVSHLLSPFPSLALCFFVRMCSVPSGLSAAALVTSTYVHSMCQPCRLRSR
ncbi:hypothetical protein B0T10DRAFT_484392 [Thelonectria olida]|uniref:Uncharacterized protein n=1 Tax=Thelonectria olida TaxID=1576542 RepID=A0A9P9ATG9_9HYPO|nr:hypothetical protein B0T10DRAFT_484392 [Thelonectria olida]